MRELCSGSGKAAPEPRGGAAAETARRVSGLSFAPFLLVSAVRAGRRLRNSQQAENEQLSVSPPLSEEFPRRSLPETSLPSPAPGCWPETRCADRGLRRGRVGGESSLLVVRSNGSKHVEFPGSVLAAEQAVASGVEWHVARGSGSTRWFCGLSLAVALATPDTPVLAQPLGLVCSVPDDATGCPMPFQDIFCQLHPPELFLALTALVDVETVSGLEEACTFP